LSRETEAELNAAHLAPGQPIPRQVWDVQANPSADAWLVTDVGIMARDRDGWRLIPLPPDILDMGGPGALGSAVGVHWIAGGQSELIRTTDDGASWGFCWLDGVQQIITCVATSPRFWADRAVLAGTLGAGVLRSTDGGRRWLLSNFGLQDFTILALATAGDWTRREVAFAGTLDGVYRSIGGGRAWKSAGLNGLAMQALAASRRYAETGLVMAGSEEVGLYRSTDGGRTWRPTGDQIGRMAGINGLLCVTAGDGEAWLVGTDAGSLWRSADAGISWRVVHETDHAVLALAAGPDAQIYAAFGEGGLLGSRDSGQTWQPVFARQDARLNLSDG
jgi:photosystem II stability/assembly factor-like uncharacterized protein